MSRLLVRNGRVVDPSQSLDQGMDLLLEDGLVKALEERVDVSSDVPVFDAAGLLVAPGFIDLNVHLREPGFEYKETIESGCKAAVRGGFTALCTMPNTEPVNDGPSITRFIREKGLEVGMARVYPIGAITKGMKGEELGEIGEMVREGAVAFSDGGRPVSNALLLRRALEYSRSFDVPIAAHEEDLDLSAGGSMHEGEVSTRIGLRAISPLAEEVMVARDLLIAEQTGGWLHLCHLSTATSIDMVRRAKARGVQVSCEVTPHHFSLTDEDVASSNYDPNFKMNPPLRSKKDVEAVLQGIYDGTVDAIATDHAPHHPDEKQLDFTDAPFGVVGLETAVPLALEKLVQSQVIGLRQFVRLFSTAPAEIFRLPGGNLKVGSPADVTILDTRATTLVDAANFESKSRNTPFAGMRLKGNVVATIVGGKIVYKA